MPFDFLLEAMAHDCIHFDRKEKALADTCMRQRWQTDPLAWVLFHATVSHRLIEESSDCSQIAVGCYQLYVIEPFVDVGFDHFTADVMELTDAVLIVQEFEKVT
jgi:hypothetical protein